MSGSGEWRKEFDQLFPGDTLGTYPGHDSPAYHGQDGECISCPVPYLYADDVKAFIEKTHKDAAREILDDLEQMKEEWRAGEGWTQDGSAGLQRFDQFIRKHKEGL